MQDVMLKDEKRTDKEVMHTFLFYVAAELIILTTSQSVKFRAVINKLLKKKKKKNKGLGSCDSRLLMVLSNGLFLCF